MFLFSLLITNNLFSISELNFLLIIIVLFLMMLDISIFKGLYQLVDKFIKKHKNWFDV